MLIFTRKIADLLIFRTSTGKGTEIVILDTKGNQVKIGTEAADDIPVIREELLEHILDAVQ